MTESTATSSIAPSPTGKGQASATNKPAPTKRKRTSAEREAEEQERARKKQEREEQKRQKAAEKARLDQEKEIAKAAKRAEKAKKDAEEQETKAKKREEEEKRERSQLRLNAFFTRKTPTTPRQLVSHVNLSPVAAHSKMHSSPEKPCSSYYHKLFQPFFVKEGVHLARSVVELDQERKMTKSGIVEGYVQGKRTPDSVAKPFDAAQILALPGRSRTRGKLYPAVGKLMLDLENGSQDSRAQLRKVPMKLLCFREDVRPPYLGTVTGHQQKVGRRKISQAARKSNARVLDLNYDYDSEAEWQDDGEEPGEDIDDDLLSDEEDGDEDDMDGFLDDSEDALAGGLRRRLVVDEQANVTGPSFEDPKRRNPVLVLREFRLQVILGKLCSLFLPTRICADQTLATADAHDSIDPFSTSYWTKDVKPKPILGLLGRSDPTKSSPLAATSKLGDTAERMEGIATPVQIETLKEVVKSCPKETKAFIKETGYKALKTVDPKSTRQLIGKMLDLGMAKGENKEWRWRC